MSKAIQDRIGELITATGLSNNAFAKRLGKGNSVIDNIVKGRSATGERHAPSYELIRLILDTAFDISGKQRRVSVDWFINGVGEMFVGEKKDNIETKDHPTVQAIKTIDQMREDHRKDKAELYQIINDYRQILANNKLLSV